MDGAGRRLGYSAATGPLAEIPDSLWLGNTDGIGWVFGPLQQPVTLHLIGLGEDYYVMVSVTSETEEGGLVDSDYLNLGQSKVLPVPIVSKTADTTPPVVTPPDDLTVPATEAGGARGSASPTLAAFLIGGSAVDNVDPSPTRLSPQVGGVNVDNNTLFALGTTTVTFRFQDASGNIGTATANVTVSDVQTLCDCDLNHDGRCDMLDWLLFGQDWGRTDCLMPGVTCECDLNVDGRCDMLDWLLFGQDWGRTDCPII